MCSVAAASSRTTPSLWFAVRSFLFCFFQDRESGTPGGGHHQQQMHHHNHQQQQMVGQMQMGPMGAFGGQPFAAGPGALMGQSMGGHMQQMQMHQQHGSGGHHQGGGGGAMPQATGNRIYVGNLAWTVEWQELKDHMRTVGKVVHADVLQDGDGRSKVRRRRKRLTEGRKPATLPCVWCSWERRWVRLCEPAVATRPVLLLLGQGGRKNEQRVR